MAFISNWHRSEPLCGVGGVEGRGRTGEGGGWGGSAPENNNKSQALPWRLEHPGEEDARGRRAESALCGTLPDLLLGLQRG